jgi:hypothetical protein
MRRVLALLGGVTIVTAALTGSVLAARSTHVSDTQTVLFCENLMNDAGVVFAAAGASDEFGSFGDLAFFAAPASPDVDPPTWVSSSAAVIVDGLSVSAAYALVEFDPSTEPPFGDPVGQASLEATLVPVGDPTPYSFTEHQGNHQLRVEGVVQDYAVTGTLDLPGDISFDLSSCVAFTDSFTLFQTNPASSVIITPSTLQLSCFWETADSFINLNAFVDPEFGTFADVFVSDPSGEYQGSALATLTSDAFSASIDLFSLAGEEEPAGSADASATLSRTGERINDIFRFDNFKTHVTGNVLAVDGTLELTTPNGAQTLTMDSVSCFAGELRVTDIESARQGPRGRPLPNDTPDAAETLALGDSITVRTGGTAIDAELPCIVEEQGELPFGHTAWWTFTGTGDPVTVDTAGSDFDTALAVYADEGGELVQVACVDDVDSLQARVTVDTLAGVTYYIQSGGFAAGSGTQVLSLE